jgi:hypothetical protein
MNADQEETRDNTETALDWVTLADSQTDTNPTLEEEQESHKKKQEKEKKSNKKKEETFSISKNGNRIPLSDKQKVQKLNNRLKRQGSDLARPYLKTQNSKST